MGIETIIFSYLLVIIFFITLNALLFHYVKALFIEPKMKEVTFAELLLILNTTVDTEIESYESSIFQQRGNITNSNYENFYHDLVKHVLSAIPDNFYRSMSSYMTKEAVIRLICRRIHKYLQEKVYTEG